MVHSYSRYTAFQAIEMDNLPIPFLSSVLNPVRYIRELFQNPVWPLPTLVKRPAVTSSIFLE